MKKLNSLFILLLLIPVVYSCAGRGNNTKKDFTKEEVYAEILRVSDLFPQIDSLCAQMRRSYSPDLKANLIDKLDEAIYFSELPTGTGFTIPTETDEDFTKFEAKHAAINKTARNIVSEYETIGKFIDEMEGAEVNANENLSAFLVGFEREHYDKAQEAISWFNKEPANSDFNLECVKNKFNSIQAKKDSLYSIYLSKLRDNEKNVRVGLMSKSELLLEEDTTYPFYLNKSDVLYLTFSTNEIVTIKIWDVNSKKLIKTINNVRNIKDAIVIPQSSVYLVDLIVSRPTYFDISISKATSREHWDTAYKINEKVVECAKSDFMAYPVTTVEIHNLFQEPRKITLRSGLKALFSGSKYSSISLNLPENTLDVAYQLRVSTNKSSDSRDGQFCNSVMTKTKTIKVFGKDVITVNKTASSLFREIINDLHKPERDEEAYCSMYVLYDSATAKSIQDGTDPSTTKYDVDNSIVQTQSTTGTIPTANKKNVYLTFANARSTANLYIWLEAVAAIKTTTYYRKQYVLE